MDLQMYVGGMGALALMLLQVTVSGHVSGTFSVQGGPVTTAPGNAGGTGSTGNGSSGSGGMNGGGGAAPASVLTAVSSSPSSSTIVATWGTTLAVASALACGTTPGSYDIAAVDNLGKATTDHQGIVAGLQPGTTYYCQVSAVSGTQTSTGTFTATTNAAEPSLAITGLSFGTISKYNAINPANQMWGDTFYNCKAEDGTTYLTSDDTAGWWQGGSSTHFSPLELAKFTSETPLAGITVNPFVAYGPGSVGTGDDNRTEKSSGLFCMGGRIFMAIGRQTNQATGGMGTATAYMQYTGQVIWSPDKGASWNNFQQPTMFKKTASVTAPASAAMFGARPTTMGTATFVMYCADDGTLGYLNACNRHDNADAYVYLMANDDHWDSGNFMYLARVPRARMADLKASDYQFYKGGDGSVDASWSSTQTDALSVITNPGKLGEPNVQYVPSLNRYLMLTFSYPQGLATADRHSEHTLWTGYEAPHPWGPWTPISSKEWMTEGYYNPIIQNDTIYSGNTPTIMFTGNFFDSASYDMYLSTMTIQHQFK